MRKEEEEQNVKLIPKAAQMQLNRAAVLIESKHKKKYKTFAAHSVVETSLSRSVVLIRCWFKR